MNMVPDNIGLAVRIIDDVRDEIEQEKLRPEKAALRLPTFEPRSGPRLGALRCCGVWMHLILAGYHRSLP
jgi:hypothetical protein